MTPSFVRRLLVCVLLMGLAACNRVAAPPTGDYRAALGLKGGELPLLLRVAAANPATNLQLTLTAGDATYLTTQVEIRDNTVTAHWPALGTLTGKFNADGIRGELRISDASGLAVTLPLTATRQAAHRFVAQSSSDNADVSGGWQLEALSTDHFTVPVLMQLRQQHDQVDGSVQLPAGGSAGVIGQTHGDEVYLGLFSAQRVVLLKGKVNAQGELQGEFWVNLGSAHPWVARRGVVNADHNESVMRQVGMPWAVPVRDITAAR